MKKLIKYYQIVQEINEETQEATEKRVDLEIELDTEHPSYSDQIKTINIYCGNDYTEEDITQ